MFKAAVWSATFTGSASSRCREYVRYNGGNRTISPGIWFKGDVVRGIIKGGYCQGGYCQGDIVKGDIVKGDIDGGGGYYPGEYWWGILIWGYCSGDFVNGDIVRGHIDGEDIVQGGIGGGILEHITPSLEENVYLDDLDISS